MDKGVIDKIKKLRKEAHDALANKLTYPKSVIGIARERTLTEGEVDKIKDCIDDSIRVIDAKLIELLDSLEKEK